MTIPRYIIPSIRQETCIPRDAPFCCFSDPLLLERHARTPILISWLIDERPLVRDSTYLLALAFDCENFRILSIGLSRNVQGQLLEGCALLPEKQVLEEGAGSLVGPIHEI